MSKKTIKGLITGGIIVAVLAVIVILIVTVVNKPTVKVIFQTDEAGTTLISYNGTDTEVCIPKKIKTVGKDAFKNQSNITKVTFETGSQVETIARNAFYECVSLASIELPSTLKTIGDGAFSGCNKLVEVVLPDSVEKIDANAFKSCLSLNSVVIGDNVKEIGDNAFAGTKIVEFNISKNLITLGKAVFADCNNLISIDVDSENTSFSYVDGILYKLNNDSKEIILVTKTILEELTISSDVTKIHSNAFLSAASLKNLIIPTTVKEIETNALIGCTNLKQITIPFIGTSASSYTTFASIFGTKVLSTLTEVTVLGGTRISEKAFKDFESLKTITLPDSITAIDSEAFSGCVSLATINNIPTNLTKITAKSFYNCSSLTDSTLKSLISSSVQIIEDRAFAGCSKITTIEINNTVKHIGLGAFENCSSISEITVPFIGMGYKLDNRTNELTNDFDTNNVFGYIFGASDREDNNTKVNNIKSVTISGSYNIPEFAFYNCSKLKTVVLNDDVEEIGQAAFSNCSSLTSLSLPLNLKVIDEYAFLECKSLTKIELSENIKTIGDCAFIGCKKISAINLHNIQQIGINVFQGCDKLTDVQINVNNENYEVVQTTTLDGETMKITSSVIFSKGLEKLICYISGNKLTEYELPQETKIICQNAFTNCQNLIKLIIPNTIEEISNQAIVSCTNLEELTLPFIGLKKNETNTFEKIFGGERPYLLSVIVLSGKTLVNDAFINVSYLKKITLPIELEEIGNNAFLNCSNLETVTFENCSNLRVIGDSAFRGASKLQNLNLPDSVESIGDQAFVDNSSVISLHIPNNLIKLGEGCFKNLSGLTSITINSTNTYYKLVNNVLMSADEKTLILYPAYVANTQYILPETVENISSYAFSGNQNLEEIQIKSNISQLPEGIFYSSVNLKKVVLPETISVIPSRAFENCKALETINVEKIVEIHAFAFKGCSKLESIELSDDLGYIGGNAFENCVSLKLINIPAKVKEISSAAFKGCSSLASVTFNEGLERILSNAFANCGVIGDGVIGYFEFPSTLSFIGANAFKANRKEGAFTKIIIPSSVVEIGESAFQQCSRLISIYISEKVQKIGDNAFADLPLGNIYTDGITITVSENGSESKTYPEGWSKSFDLNTLKLYGKGQFTIVENEPQPIEK